MKSNTVSVFYFMEKKMKVDIVIPTGGKGGVEKVVNIVAKYLINCGMKIRIVQMIKGNVKWHDETIPFFTIYENIEGHNVDTFVNGYVSFLSKNGKPDIVLATNWPLMSFVCKKACENENIKIVSWIHNQIDRYAADNRGGMELLSYADAHLAICKDIYDTIEKTIQKNNVFLVHNPVERVGAELKKANNTNTLVYIGRIHKVKRLDFILTILGVCKNWKLKIIGSGEEELENTLKEIAKEINVSDRVEWIGWVENPWDYAKSATALIMASEFEGFPMVALEASSMGLPIISTSVSGINEYVENYKNGYIYNKGDLVQVSNYLLDIEENLVDIPDPAICRKSVEVFSKENVCKNIKNVLLLMRDW